MTALAVWCPPIEFPTQYKNVVASCSRPISDAARFGIRKAQERYEDTQLRSLTSFLDGLKTWPNNWDSYGAKKPKTKSIEAAKKFLQSLFRLLQTEYFEWLNPNITGDCGGDIVCEWWKKDKKLTIYISDNEIAYIKVPSPKIEEMEDGILNGKLEELKSIWVWLNY